MYTAEQLADQIVNDPFWQLISFLKDEGNSPTQIVEKLEFIYKGAK